MEVGEVSLLFCLEKHDYIGKGVIERDITRLIPNKESEIVLYCQGGFRSALAGESIQKMGYKNVFSMSGGYSDWIANN